MLERFSREFSITSSSSVPVDDQNDFYKDIPIELFELIKLFGGFTFNNGLYRIHSFRSSIRWSSIITAYFNNHLNAIYPFGFDWMGRQFCLGVTKKILFMFDPSTGEFFELDQSIVLLHEEDFANDPDGMLAANLFNEALSFCKLKSIDYDECMGYKTPLFLGGTDNIENLQKQDLEVYWHIETELYKKIKDLPEGTKINSIKIE